MIHAENLHIKGDPAKCYLFAGFATEPFNIEMLQYLFHKDSGFAGCHSQKHSLRQENLEQRLWQYGRTEGSKSGFYCAFRGGIAEISAERDGRAEKADALSEGMAVVLPASAVCPREGSGNQYDALSMQQLHTIRGFSQSTP